MKKKFFLIAALISLSLSTPTFSLFGGGGSSGIGKLVGIVTKISDTQIQMQLEQIQQGLNQLEMLSNQMKNMANIDGVLATSQLTGLQQAFQSMLNIQNNMTSQINNYKDFQTSFKQVYTDFKDFKNLTPDDYLFQANKILTQTRNIAEDSMKTAGVVNADKLMNDAQRVRALMSRTNSLEGQKAVLQAGVGMAAMQYEVLTDLKLLMSQSLNAQNAYVMKQVQEEELTRQEFEAGRGVEPNINNKSSGVFKLINK